MYDIGQMDNGYGPRAGMQHVTVAGSKQHGMRNFEVWMQTIAPGGATPIHSHPRPCEEVNFVLKVSRRRLHIRVYLHLST